MTGFSVIATVVFPAANHDLTDLASVKGELSINTVDAVQDKWLGQAITQVSKAVARYCKRCFAPEQVQDQFDIGPDARRYQAWGGCAPLDLSRWPVLAVQSVVQTNALGSTQALIEGRDFRSDPATGQLFRLDPFTGRTTSWEAVPVAVIYTAGYGTVIQESHSVPAATPFVVQIAQSATFSADQSVSYAGGTPLTRVTGVPGPGQYSVANATYYFNAADAGRAIAFAYTTTAIPEDLVEICLRLVSARFRAKGRDPALVQQDTPGMGTQRWWFGGAPGQTGPFPPDIEAALDEGYRVPVIA